MPLEAGSSIGPYTVVSKLGEGGMGEVYRARDSKLKREVALKVLPADVANDRERLARFQREAEVLASLNHPNIAHIHGLEENALVMELVEGEDLAERIRRGPIPIDEALPIAKQVAEALEAAHEAGIVHRDLKPANVKVRPDGTVKVLDFGLAKGLETGTGSREPGTDLANSPTITSPAMTMRGVILGTAAYMAPEQAKGKPVDKRADIWAFGCVLFEMLSGRRAFTGETTTEIIAAVIEREPDWGALPRTTPASVQRLLRRLLAKRPAARLRDIGDAQHDLGLEDVEPIPARAAGVSWRIVTAAAAAAALIGAASTAYLSPFATFPRTASSAPLTFTLPVPASQNLALSADGGTLVWTAPGKDRVPRLWIRRLSSTEAIELAGTDNAAAPFLSPDGRSAGFFEGGALKRVDVSSGAVQTLAPSATVSLGGTWSRDDVILFSNRFGLHRIPAGGGTPQLVVPLNPALRENSLRSPEFLPDGRRFVYVARSGRPEDSGAYLGSLDAPPRRLFSTLAKVMFAPPDQLLFVRDGTLLAQEIDLATGQLRGTPITVTADLMVQTVGMNAEYHVSETGVLVYGPAREQPTGTLHWFDRSGRDLGAFDQSRVYNQFRLSPDARRVAAAVPDLLLGSRSIWILEAGVPPARFTFAGTHDWEPVWSPDGTRIAFGSYRNGPLDMYVRNAAGLAPEAPLLLSPHQKDISDWSPDGRFVMYRDTQGTSSGDLAVMEVSNPANVQYLTRSAADERISRWSGDGKWVAYTSNETGDNEIFVQPFPPTGAKWQVSIGGGDEPVWRRDGRELYYIDGAGMLIAVTVDGSPASFSPVRSRPLFPTGLTVGGAFGNRYDAAGDGQRFLVSVDDPRPPARPPVVVINWRSALALQGSKP